MAKVKLIDVARFAGVSKSTASQYLNGRFDYMSKVTQERLRAAIAELDYVPNPIARNLKAAKTKTIGVVVRDITGFYTSRVIRGIDDYCKQNDYNALIYNTDFDPDIEAKSIEALYQLRVDGIIIASSGNNTKLIDSYIEKGTPIVHFQIEHDGSEQNIILSDYKKAAFDATEYLIELGHKRICFVTQDFKNVNSRIERHQGYVDAHMKHGIPVDDSLVQYWQRELGFQKQPVDIVKDCKPTAFFTQHLPITIELLRHLNQANITVPDDVSLIGFDEIPMAEFFKVPITVVKQEPYLIGMETTKLLLSNIDDDSKISHKILIPCTLQLRESCKNI